MYCPDTEFFDIAEFYIEKAAADMLRKSIVLMIIQGVVLAFSLWDKNSRFFVILAAIGVYSVYGSLSVRIDMRCMEKAAKRLSEIQCRQFVRTLDTRRENFPCDKEIFIPEKEDVSAHTILFSKNLQTI